MSFVDCSWTIQKAEVNKCATNNGGCDVHRSCTNKLEGFECGPCAPGYDLSADVCIPQDVNECAVNNGGCGSHRDCINTVGSFSCGDCYSGYSGLQCQDINECATNNGGCSSTQECRNSDGSFDCFDCSANTNLQNGKCVSGKHHQHPSSSFVPSSHSKSRRSAVWPQEMLGQGA